MNVLIFVFFIKKTNLIPRYLARFISYVGDMQTFQLALSVRGTSEELLKLNSSSCLSYNGFQTSSKVQPDTTYANFAAIINCAFENFC